MAHIERHADPTLVTISMRNDADGRVLQIQDDGSGISASEMTGAGSIGLLGMRERARSFGGNLTVDGNSGKGTTLWIQIPTGGDHSRADFADDEARVAEVILRPRQWPQSLGGSTRMIRRVG